MDLIIACESGNEEKVRELINDKYKDRLHYEYDGRDIVSLAIIARRPNIVYMLVNELSKSKYISFIVNFTANAMSGMTPFLWCLRTNQLDLAILLLKNGYSYNSIYKYKYDFEYSLEESDDPGPTLEDFEKLIDFDKEKLAVIKYLIEQEEEEDKKMKEEYKRKERISNAVSYLKSIQNSFIPRDIQLLKESDFTEDELNIAKGILNSS